MTLEARALWAFHGRIPALHEVDVSVPPSGIVTVVGPNGAGKSTLLAALMGRLPMSGEVRLDGTDLRFVSPERRVAMGLALVPEQRDLFGTLSVADNLELGAFCWRPRGPARDRRRDGARVCVVPAPGRAACAARAHALGAASGRCSRWAAR